MKQSGFSIQFRSHGHEEGITASEMLEFLEQAISQDPSAASRKLRVRVNLGWKGSGDGSTIKDVTIPSRDL